MGPAAAIAAYYANPAVRARIAEYCFIARVVRGSPLHRELGSCLDGLEAWKAR